MQTLKKILQSKYLYICLILTTILYVLSCNLIPINSKYSGLEENLAGIITSLKIDGNKLTLELNAKERIIVFYYLKEQSEINYIQNNYHLGDKIKVIGNLEIPSRKTIFNLFNYKKYLKSKKIYWIFNANSIQKIDYKISLKYKLKNFIMNRINLNSDVSNYLYTFILGDNSFMESDVKNSYQINGISHLFAISGMHITLFSTLILLLLNKISNKKLLNNLIVILFLIIYSFLTNYTPSVLRSVLLFIFCIINNTLKFNIKTIYLLILTCIFLLIINPFYIHNLGFIFSYTITFYLIIFSDLINKRRNYFSKLLMTSLISFLVGLPIVINNFFSINILSIILNLIFVNIVSFIIFPLSLITFLFPHISNILLFFINILENMSLYFSKISFFNITLCHMNFYVFIGYYILITMILISLKKEKYYMIIVLLIVIFIHHNILLFNIYPVITMIDVGQGDSILIILPNNKGNILIDTGGIISYYEEWQKRKNKNSLALNKTIPYLKSVGVKKLDYLILSHGDYDHMGEAINLVEKFKVERVIFNCGEFNELEQGLIKVLDKKKIPYYSCIKELNIGDNKLYFLNNKDYGNENDNSNVIYFNNNNYKFLFMGDAGVEVEKDLIDKYNISNIDVLKVGHHGSKTSSSKDFIEEIDPEYSIISVGKNNRYGHPNKEVLNNLESSKIYRTDQDGSIMFKIKNNKLKIETCSP